MSPNSLSIEQSIYRLIELTPEEHRHELFTILLPHFNVTARRISVRIYNKLSDQLQDDSAIFEIVCDCVSNNTGIIDIPNTRTRKHIVKLSRHMVQFCMVHELVNEGMMSLTALGKLFHGCPAHSSMIYAEKNIGNLYATDINVFNMMNSIAECLSAKGYTRTQLKLQSIKTYVKRQSK